MTEPLEIIVKEPKNTADSCVIWLHGLGADGHDFENIVPEFKLPDPHGIRFLFPHAPMRPITINQHMLMRGWYDIYSLNNLEQEDKSGIEDSCNRVQQLMQTQIDQGIPIERIILAGFSQGGAIALYLGLTYPEALAGIIALSAYLPFVRKDKREFKITHSNTPLLLCHGDYDDIIPTPLGMETVDYLRRKGLKPSWHTYPMGHQVCSAEIQMIGKWITRLLHTPA